MFLENNKVIKCQYSLVRFSYLAAPCRDTLAPAIQAVSYFLT